MGSSLCPCLPRGALLMKGRLPPNQQEDPEDAVRNQWVVPVQRNGSFKAPPAALRLAPPPKVGGLRLPDLGAWAPPAYMAPPLMAPPPRREREGVWV